MSPIEMLTFCYDEGGGRRYQRKKEDGVRGEAWDRFCDFMLND